MNIFSYLGSFVMGVALTIASLPALNFLNNIFWGFEVNSRASFPMEHLAKVRTRPGIGDQTLFLEVDGEDVWHSGNMPPGNLDEEVSWNNSASVVTLKLQNQHFISYDVESKKVTAIENKAPVRLR